MGAETAIIATPEGDFVQVGWWYEDSDDGGRLCWSSHITRAPWWKNARNIRPAYDLRPTPDSGSKGVT